MAKPNPMPSVPIPDSLTPRWVTLLTDLGRPIVAAWVMIMCAPGEHHLGRLAGWSDHLAWGMAGVLAAYAGIAAAVASKRPKGAPGKGSAVAGAWLSLAAAMSAQPVSHLFVTGHWTAEPRPPVWLVVTVSCVPPLVLGHLLHLAATPVLARVMTPVNEDQEPLERLATAPINPAAPVQAPAVPAAPAPHAITAAVPRPPVVPEGARTLPVMCRQAVPVPAHAPQPPAPIQYSDPRCTVIRALYDTMPPSRPGTKAMRTAILDAGHSDLSDGMIRGQLRAEVETHEPHLAQLPPAPFAIGA